MAAGYRRKRQTLDQARISSKIANGVRSRLRRCHAGHRLRPEGLRTRGVPPTAPTSTTCTVSCRHWCAAPATSWCRSRSTTATRTRGVSKYGTLDRLAVGIVDLFGVMWLQRRARAEIE